MGSQMTALGFEMEDCVGDITEDSMGHIMEDSVGVGVWAGVALHNGWARCESCNRCGAE